MTADACAKTLHFVLDWRLELVPTAGHLFILLHHREEACKTITYKINRIIFLKFKSALLSLRIFIYIAFIESTYKRRIFDNNFKLKLNIKKIRKKDRRHFKLIQWATVCDSRRTKIQLLWGRKFIFLVGKLCVVTYVKIKPMGSTYRKLYQMCSLPLQNSELFQEQLGQTLCRKSPKICPSYIIDAVRNSSVHKQS